MYFIFCAIYIFRLLILYYFQEMESLSSLNLDLVDSLDLDLEELEGMSDKDLDALDANSPEKKRMNISKILSGTPAPRKLVDSRFEINFVYDKVLILEFNTSFSYKK